jgi:hypothetical protein
MPTEVVVGNSTSVNLFNVAARRSAWETARPHHHRWRQLSDRPVRAQTA